MSTGMSFAEADADRAAFLEDGVVCLRNVLNPAEVEREWRRAERQRRLQSFEP